MASQHGLVTLEQLRSLGLNSAAVRRRVEKQLLHRIHRAVYAPIPSALLTRNGLYMAAVLACGAEAVLSHRSAAALLRIRPSAHPRIEVTVPRRAARKHPGLEIHRSTTLTDRDRGSVQRIPCTTVARSLLDLAAVLPQRAIERAMDQAEIEGLFDLRALEAQLAANPHAAGHRLLRAVLAEHCAGSTFTWSELEERFLALVRRAGLPRPSVDFWIVLPDGEPAIRADFVWPEQRLVVETDGRATHSTRGKFERDRHNDHRLLLHGWRPVRFTWLQVTAHSARTAEALSALLALGPAPHS